MLFQSFTKIFIVISPLFGMPTPLEAIFHMPSPPRQISPVPIPEMKGPQGESDSCLLHSFSEFLK